jgi:threonine/homoserine/homoserine lactone efflux protein
MVFEKAELKTVKFILTVNSQILIKTSNEVIIIIIMVIVIVVAIIIIIIYFIHHKSSEGTITILRGTELVKYT